MRCPWKILALALAPLLFGHAAADDAILPDGRRLPGTLQLDKGRLHFAPAGQGPSLRLDQLHHVYLPDGAVPGCLGGTVHHVALADGQRLTGELVGLDAQELRLHTPWAATVALPRQIVRAITQPRGFVTLVDEDFESGLRGWKLTGGPALDGRQRVSGEHSVLLDRPGQAAAYHLSEPLASGRAGINFFDAGKESGARWLVEFVFLRAPTTGILTVAAGDTSYEVKRPGTARLPRRGGWHCLVVEFGPASALVTVDDQVLWSGQLVQGFALAGVGLRWGAPEEKGAGSVWFDDFTLARAVEDLRRQDADPRQDEVWLLSGDQLLGTVMRADRRSVELEARFGKRTLPWGTVRGLFLRQGKDAALKADAGQVRVWLRAVRGTADDQLVGQVRGLSDKRLTLRNALLGELAIERAWMRRVAMAD